MTRKLSTAQRAKADEVTVIDPMLRFQLATDAELNLFKLNNKLTPVLSFPLRYNTQTQRFELGTAPGVEIIGINGTPVTARDWSSDFAKLQNLDVALSVLARLYRWGRNVVPSWVHGGEVSAPAAGAALVSKTVSTGKSGYIYGFFIMASEGNDFLVKWTSGGAAYSIRVPLGGKGVVQYADFIAMNEGLPANPGSTISIVNVNPGATGSIYQARLLYGEV
ncbi:MAG: hypothetical protein BA066_07240 [Candidatus Korarchaeota archaeon NZ13-K]|nr:MAG: hypothetical protein BA066_07240 [Candidatus Korarchaeota archaeon NZ13-K]